MEHQRLSQSHETCHSSPWHAPASTRSGTSHERKQPILPSRSATVSQEKILNRDGVLSLRDQTRQIFSKMATAAEMWRAREHVLYLVETCHYDVSRMNRYRDCTHWQGPLVLASGPTKNMNPIIIGSHTRTQQRRAVNNNTNKISSIVSTIKRLHGTMSDNEYYPETASHHRRQLRERARRHRELLRQQVREISHLCCDTNEGLCLTLLFCAICCLCRIPTT